MKQIQINEIGEVTLKKSARAKRLILRVNADGRAIVTIPSYVPYGIAEKFARQHTAWFLEHKPSLPQLILSEGKMIGRSHSLKFVPKAVEKVSSRIQSGIVYISYPQNLAVTDSAVQHEARKGAVRALKRQAEMYLPGKLHELSEKNGYSYSEVRIKTVQTRWGSCSNKRIINLSVWLMQLPDELIEYVLCHELTHLSHMNHQANFWAELSTMIPDFKDRKQKLKTYNPTLM